jgi:hypothetical protein
MTRRDRLERDAQAVRNLLTMLVMFPPDQYPGDHAADKLRAEAALEQLVHEIKMEDLLNLNE